MPKLWGVNQCLLDPRPELVSGTPQASSLGSYAPKTGVLSSLSPGSDGICWILWCLCVAWKQSGDRCGPKLNHVGLTLPLLTHWNFLMGKRAGKMQYSNASGIGKAKYSLGIAAVIAVTKSGTGLASVSLPFHTGHAKLDPEATEFSLASGITLRSNLIPSTAI